MMHGFGLTHLFGGVAYCLCGRWMLFLDDQSGSGVTILENAEAQFRVHVADEDPS